MKHFALVFGLLVAFANFGCAGGEDTDADGGVAGDGGSGASGGTDGGTGGTDGGTGGTDGGTGGTDGGTGEACYLDDDCDCGLAEPPDCPDAITAGDDFECDLRFVGGVVNAGAFAFDPGATEPGPPAGTGFVEGVPANGRTTITIETDPTAVGVQVISIDWDAGDPSRFSVVDGMSLNPVGTSCSLTKVTFEAP